jgi:hypothetical protein
MAINPPTSLEKGDFTKTLGKSQTNSARSQTTLPAQEFPEQEALCRAQPQGN